VKLRTTRYCWRGRRLEVAARFRHNSCVPVGELVRPEQQCQPPEDIVHSGGTEDAGSIDETTPIDGPDLRDIHDACARESRFTVAKANVSRHGSKPEVRRDSRDDCR
jgi:hypothetical protein